VKLIYIAGPYGAMTPAGIKKNVARARDMAAACRGQGWFFICPHLNTTGFEKYTDEDWNTWEKWMEMDLAILERCDAVLLMPGWEKSDGARMERSHAIALGIPTFDFQLVGIPSPGLV